MTDTEAMKKGLLRIFIITFALFMNMPLYAQEQDIADSFGLYSRGVEYYREGKLLEARELLERAVSLDPRNDEAQGYLDLVNAELRMRQRGKLDVYQNDENLKRESDFGGEEPYSGEETYNRESGYSEYSAQIGDYERPDTEPGGPPPGKDRIKSAVDTINEKIQPARIRGEYKMSFGVTTQDFIWKKANGDYNERNFRMISHEFPKTDTFDTRVFDRLKVVFDTNTGGEGFNLHSDITIDPWSFVGKTDKFTVISDAGTDSVEMELKYWSGTNRTINETFYTRQLGDSMSTSEYKVTDGKIPSFKISSNWSTFTIPEKEVDFTFQPVRELWFDYDREEYKLRVFPYGLEDQALSSDDPLGLSNHHIYWEPSPWLDQWVPGHINTGAAPNDFWRGEWSDDLSFFTRDSDLRRLTALRGVSLQGALFNNTDISMTIASPKGLWQDYGDINALPGAIRTKTQLTDNLMVGLIDTFRIGYDDDEKRDAFNNVIGMDFGYDWSENLGLSGEVAYSKSEYDRRFSTYKTDRDGIAGHLGVKGRTAFGDINMSFTHMDDDFDPGLANYRETRRDMHWSRHIYFKKPLESTMWGTAVDYNDVEPFRIGDGVDTGRNAFNFRIEKKDAFDGKMDNLIHYRYVRGTDHKYIEGVFREENTFRINPEWTSKALVIYHDLPKTKGGIDPLQYDSDTGEFLKNTAVEDGKDPTLSTYSMGLEYSPREWISIFGIYENTNDYKLGTGNHPSGLLNSTYFSTETIGGNVYRKEVPQLYNQGYFDQPPYERFNIFKAGVSLRPMERLGIDFDYTKNDFKFASGIDDNMNHMGMTVKYDFTPRLTGFLKYTYSRLYNLYRLNTSGDLKYEGHHNVFMEFDYNISKYSMLVVQFGEGSVVSPVWGATASPYGDFYPTLDTQHILRVYYQGVF